MQIFTKNSGGSLSKTLSSHWTANDSLLTIVSIDFHVKFGVSRQANRSKKDLWVLSRSSEPIVQKRWALSGSRPERLNRAAHLSASPELQQHCMRCEYEMRLHLIGQRPNWSSGFKWWILKILVNWLAHNLMACQCKYIRGRGFIDIEPSDKDGEAAVGSWASNEETDTLYSFWFLFWPWDGDNNYFCHVSESIRDLEAWK